MIFNLLIKNSISLMSVPSILVERDFIANIYSGRVNWLVYAGHGTRLKREPIRSNYGSQGKSQAQPDGGEVHSVITT